MCIVVPFFSWQIVSVEISIAIQCHRIIYLKKKKKEKILLVFHSEDGQHKYFSQVFFDKSHSFAEQCKTTSVRQWHEQRIRMI